MAHAHLAGTGCMLFFYKLISSLNKSYGVLFGLDDEGPDDETETGDTEENETTDPFTERWGWVSCIDTVAETMRIDWGRVTRLPVTEFLNVVCYARDKNQQRNRDLNKNKRFY